MNSNNSKTFDPKLLLVNFSDKTGLKRSRKYVILSNLSIYYTSKHIKKKCKNNKIKMSAPTWNDKSELPDGSYSMSDIQDYFQCVFKKTMEKRLITLQ